jgi:membrane fusion protein, multidrug efflux system
MAETDPTKTSEKEKNPRRPLIIGGIVAVVVLLIGVIWYVATAGVETTDDAFVDAHIIPISCKVSGLVEKVYVDDNQAVKAGDPIVDIDPRDYKAEVDQEQAKVNAAAADARRAAADAKRYQDIFQRDEISRQQLDNAQAAAATTQAALAQQGAALERAKLNLAYAKITAPESGRITKKSVESGSYIQVGQNLLSIVPDQVWITANFKETQLTHMHSGQKVRIKVDTYPGKVFEGHVESLQSGTGERFSTMPAENATGNFVKVVQRIPVKILIDSPMDPNHRLLPGMSAEPKVYVKE